MQREKITVEIPVEMMAAEKLGDLETISQKLEAEVRKPYKTKRERMNSRTIEWSSRMTDYEIMLLTQAVLLFQNLILAHVRQSIRKDRGTDGESKKAERTGDTSDKS